MKMTIRASASPERSDRLDHRPVVGGRGGGDHVDRVRGRRLRRELPAQALAKFRRELDDLQAGGLAGVCAHDPRPAGIGDNGHPGALGERLVGKHADGVEELGLGCRCG